jgi:outer membrane protein OmpA-like peptidoglycan-associated protein
MPAAPRAATPQTAAVPPSSVPSTPGGRTALSIAFAEGSVELPRTAEASLQSLAKQLAANEAQRLQLLAYASGTPDTASQARRLSLSRALAIRSYLIEHGVRSTRIDVRALGARAAEGAPDRVDMVFVDQ